MCERLECAFGERWLSNKGLIPGDRNGQVATDGCDSTLPREATVRPPAAAIRRWGVLTEPDRSIHMIALGE
jgi:hypothetical protein